MWSVRAADRRRRTGRGLRAALASLVLPGAGQLLVGRRRKGAVLIGAALGVGILGGWLASRGATTVAGWVLRPDVLLWLIGVNLVLALFRLYATFDAYADGVRPAAVPVSPRSAWRSAGVAGVLVGLAVVVAAPHMVVGYYATSTRDLLAAVFIEDTPTGDPDLAPAPEPGPPADQPTEGPDTGEAPAGPSDEVGEAPAEPAEPAPNDAPPEPQANPWEQAGRVTVALLGSDAGAGRAGDRIDSLLVVTVDTATGDAAVFSIDRYLADFPLPDRIAEVYEQHCPYGDGWEYLNALYRCGHERVPEAFAEAYPRAEDPAAAAMADVLGELLGFDVPHYAMVDMAGFVAVVDALGGVEVDLASPLLVRMSPPEGGDWYTVDLPAGRQTLDGKQALAYVRVRAQDGGDADRMRRQRCLLSSVADTAEVGTILRNFPALASAVEDHVITGIPIDLLPDLIELMPAVDGDRIATVGFGPPDYRGWDHRPDVPRIQQQVQQVLHDPDIASDEGTTTELSDTVCR